jgi:hypothetical protein
MAEKKSDKEQQSERTMRLLAVVMGAGLLGILVNAAQFWNQGQFASVTGLSIVMAGASAVGGGLLGFLFAIPRALPAKREVAPTSEAQPNTGDTPQYEVNTNLEEISDWLTKILVGVGLTELRNVPEAMESVAKRLGPVLGGAPSSGAFAETLLLYFAICGFLEGYLWTRVFLAGEFQMAAVALLGKRVQELEDQTQRDGRAMALALSQLNPAAGAPSIAQARLDDAILAASSVMRAQVFYQAQALRTTEWNLNKERMELTIPIFRALIASDRKGKFHRNHAQLGYALKDQRRQNWPEAQRELSLAIEIRGSWQEHGWVWYEFNRAVCLIAQDEAFQHDQASAPEVRATILDDLRVAATKLASRFSGEPRIAVWLKLNAVKTEELKLNSPPGVVTADGGR